MVGDPGIDEGARRLGIGLEVDRLEARGIVGLHQGRVIGKKTLILRRPERVGHVQFVIRVCAIEMGEEGAHCRVKATGREREVERSGHFSRGCAASTGRGHGKGGSDAGGGKEEVAGRVA